MRNRLLDYIASRGVKETIHFSDEVFHRGVSFPLAALETRGAILFADLPGYSRIAARMSPVECAYMVSHFFGWFEGNAGRQFGGIVDKFIGDEIMVVFPERSGAVDPFDAALRTAHAMLSNDPYGFGPKIGIAAGPIAIAVVGAQNTVSVTAMGNTVNLASRCVKSVTVPNGVRVVSGRAEPVKKVFQGSMWRMSEPHVFEPKNLSAVPVVDVEKIQREEPEWDYLEVIRQGVRYARERGAVREDREKFSDDLS
jgi:class 3 adenylate cyclase